MSTPPPPHGADPQRLETRESDFRVREEDHRVPALVWLVSFTLVALGVLISVGSMREAKQIQQSFPSAPGHSQDAHAAKGSTKEQNTHAIKQATLDGAALYKSNCASCHGHTGKGISNAVPPLAGSLFVNADPVKLAQLPLRGIRGPIHVNGQLYNGVMPAFADTLSDDQLAAILTYERSAWGNSAGPVTAAQVAQARTAISGKVGPWLGGQDILKQLGLPNNPAGGDQP